LPERFAAASLEYNRPPIVPNTRLALRLTELAREHGLHEQFHDRLMDAYWSEATDIGAADELRRLAAEVGLDTNGVERVLADSSAYLDVVEASTRQAQSIGINAIPASARPPVDRARRTALRGLRARLRRAARLAMPADCLR
jgi:predicted DsbA family dithiol-disulfide isomerase